MKSSRVNKCDERTTVGIKKMHLPFYRASEEDFVGLVNRYRLKYQNPTYIGSPYGSWLAMSGEMKGSFSDWFRSESSRNRHYEGVIELKKQLETDSNGNSVFRYYEDKYFPVDGRGWGAEGQRDCYSNALRNYGLVM